MSNTPTDEEGHLKYDEKITVADVEEEPAIEDIDYSEEKRILRKIDWNLIPVFGALYMMSFLDRSNIGNANLTTFSTDLGLVNNQFGAATSVVYATYVVFEPFWTVLLKIIKPRYLLTATTLCWASITIGSAFIKNYDQLLAVRILLGAFEAGMIPCTTLYLTMTYNRDEYVSRQTVVFVFSAISSAFGGLLAFGLSHIKGNLAGWQWLFLVEGIISMCLVPIAWFQIPNEVTEARWLKPHEKETLIARRQRNKMTYDDNEEFSWGAIISVLKDYRLYISAISHFGIDSTLYSLTTFVPSLLAGLGFTSTTDAQLLTVPVYAVGAFAFIFCGRMSDKTKLRGPFIAGSLFFGVIGYIMLAVAPQVGVRYAAVFIAAIALYTSTSLNVLWAADNFSGHYRRAFAMGFIQLVGNSAGACIGFIFTSQSAPRYLKGIYYDIGVTIMSICFTCILMFIAWIRNKKKREAISAGASNQPELGDANPHYMYFL
ncbi:high-affinity nicotinic acid transporter [Cryptococcus neoformans]|nr:high-affinity nicotinic acid transporter [Cryptococcus neoformans var. grubii]